LNEKPFSYVYRLNKLHAQYRLLELVSGTKREIVHERTYKARIASERQPHHEYEQRVSGLERHQILVYQRKTGVRPCANNPKGGIPVVPGQLVRRDLIMVAQTNQIGLIARCWFGGKKSSFHLDIDIYGESTANGINIVMM
jgi:hypothetical protein